MLGLPSTTEVGKRIPKEAFYRNLKLDKRTRDEFVSLIERITIANSIKPSTANLRDGRKVHEIIVLSVDLKGGEVPYRAIEAIAKGNQHRLVFRIESIDATLVVHGGTHMSDTIERIVLRGEDLDAAWSSIVSQVALGSEGGKDVDARIAAAKRRAELQKEIAALDAKCRKEKQISRRNELYEKLREKTQELKELERESADL